MTGLWQLAIEVLRMIYVVFLQTAPFLLLGLVLAGWSKILIRTQGVHRFLGGGNLRSAFYAALFGLPLPICSCGVVPVSLSVRDKGASREANLSFLISTPETSVDTLVITWGLLGPLMTIVRPIAAFATAMFAAALSIADRTDRDPEDAAPAPTCDADHNHDLGEDHDVLVGDYNVVGIVGFWRSLRAAVLDRGDRQPADSADADAEPADVPVPLGVLVKDANRYAFVEMLDDLSLWFVLGIAVAGAIAALVPGTWITDFPGGNLGSMLFVLVLSVPMYVCAVESTPIAAMLLLKGLSPGAALVFLLAGPATNAATLLIIAQSYGRRFLRIYLAAIAIVAVASGLALDALLAVTGWQVLSRVAESSSGLWYGVQLIAAIVLLVLLAFSFYRLDWTAKWAGFKGAGGRMAAVLNLFVPISSLTRVAQTPRRRRNRWALVALFVAAYLATGIYQIGPGDAGFRLRLGKLVAADISPGLHYRLPFPLEKVAIFRVDEVRKTDLGFVVDTNLVRRWRQTPDLVADTGWHSFFTTMSANNEQSVFLIGDENQLEAKFGVHYRIDEPTAFFFDYAKNKDLVGLAAESVMRVRLAHVQIDTILTQQRRPLATDLRTDIQTLVDTYGIGVEILGVYPVDMHPPVAAVAAFRDVASAMEDRQTRIHQAFAAKEKALPKARGEAAKLHAAAEAAAVEAVADGSGRAASFTARAEALRAYRAGTKWRLFVEAMETSLAGTPKILLPGSVAERAHLRLWRGREAPGTGLMQPGDKP
jgi:HflK protein